jgi:hypothetical protein
MSNISDPNPPTDDTADQEFSPEEVAFTPENIATVIQELEQYRERLVTETMATAQKAKMMKSKVMTDLEPELTKIDAMLQELRDRQAAMLAEN